MGVIPAAEGCVPCRTHFTKSGQEPKLPVIPIPLLPSDKDVALDMQQVFTMTYDLLGYDLAIDYTQVAEIPLPEADVTWAETLLRTAGLRDSPKNGSGDVPA